MTGLTVILGFGSVGRPTTLALLARGDAVCVAQRNRPADLPAQAEFAKCDVLDAASVRHAIEGASQVVMAVAFPYDAKVWRASWPKAMANLVEACAATGARLVLLDNLYQLGPQTEPRREDMALTTGGGKPGALADVTRIWQAATGRARVAALRCTDFYGPGVTNSYLGTTGFGALARGKSALVISSPDMPHDFAYVPDIARAIVTLLDAPDDAFGQAWNMPCAPTLTSREILRLGAAAIHAKPKVMAIPLWMLRIIGLAAPFMREVAEVSFTMDRPYQVDATKFTRRFWSDVTPFEVGAPATARSFLSNAPGEPLLPTGRRGG